MSFVIRKASRTVSKMRIGVFGVSGSGKTYSALLLAKGLVGGDLSKVVVIDTENGSADLYSHLGEYSVLPLLAPFTTKRYIEAIKTCESMGYECIIIDSISHGWEGSGGCIDMHGKLGGKFETWAKVTPLHQEFLQSIIQCTKHIICTGRSKTDYSFEAKSAGGKGRVEKVGLKTVTKEGFDYEMTIAFQISQDHMAIVDKDRTELFSNSIPFLIDEKIGTLIKNWNETAAAAPEIKNVLPVGQGKNILPIDPKRVIFDKVFGLFDILTNGFKDELKKVEIMKLMGISSGKELQVASEEDLKDWYSLLEEYAAKKDENDHREPNQLCS
jgi:hypothetical protein